MKPIYITETPNTFRISFEYNKQLVETLRRSRWPCMPRWDAQEKEWIVKKESICYPPGRDARWYVEAFAQWAVANRYCTNISRRSESYDVVYEIPPMKNFAGEHYMLLNPYEYQLEGAGTS